MASFTRKHYVEIARILNGVQDRRERQRLADEFARLFRQDNPAFDVERFSSAVYGEGGVRETNQPEWEQVGHIGDVNWLEYGGGPVEVDKTGVYPPEVEYVEPPSDDVDPKKARWTVYRVILDPGVPDWGDLGEVARSIGGDPKMLQADFESADPVIRATAYQDWAGYYGWHEFDQYPLMLTRAEVEKRYNADLGELREFTGQHRRPTARATRRR